MYYLKEGNIQALQFKSRFWRKNEGQIGTLFSSEQLYSSPNHLNQTKRSRWEQSLIRCTVFSVGIPQHGALTSQEQYLSFGCSIGNLLGALQSSHSYKGNSAKYVNLKDWSSYILLRQKEHKLIVQRCSPQVHFVDTQKEHYMAICTHLPQISLSFPTSSEES
jgi:hypothetical protein